MRGILILAVILGLVGGLLGMFAFGELSGRAGAAGSVTEQAEVTLLAEQGIAFDQTPGETYYNVFGAMASIDTTTFPAGTTFTLNLAGAIQASSYCFRLAEPVGMTEFNPVPDSEVCRTSDSEEWFALQSQPFALLAGNHLYTFQYQRVAGPGATILGNIRVLAEWQDYSPPVGGIAVFPDISSSTGQNYAILVGLAFVAVVAFAAGGWYARRRWLG